MKTPLLDSVSSPKDLRKFSIKELELIAEEMRSVIIDTVSKNGGHLAPNLGSVEFTLALHRVFDFSKDKIIFDVGHQSYSHKLITGRKELFHTLRKYQGVSGYTNPEESAYDAFLAGHSSTSLALAVGFVKARELKKENYQIVAVIGDGAMTAGEAYEGLNILGHIGKKVLVVLNDNEMSIAKNVGALSRYLYKLRSSKTYQALKKGNFGSYVGRKIKLAIKELLLPNILFEEFGFTYLGPIDGHNIREMMEVFERSKNIKGPVLVHIMTKKGKGYTFAEEDPIKFHGTEAFDVETGNGNSANKKTFSEYFGEVLTEESKKNDRIFAITAAMPDGTKMSQFKELFPERYLDVGIAEQSAVTVAAALAKEGLRPVVAIYSTFMQRAFDQLVHDVAILQLPVIFMLDRGGVVSDDGPTHQGVFDVSYMRIIPSFIVSAPKDGHELQSLFRLALNSNTPFVIRYPKDTTEFKLTDKGNYEIGKSEVIYSGSDLLIVSYGAVFQTAMKLKEELEKRGHSVGLINAIYAKPLDRDALISEANKSKRIVTIEDNTVIGGFGSAVSEIFSSSDVKVYSFGINDFFPEQGKRKFLLEKYGVSVEKMSQFCERIIGEKKN